MRLRARLVASRGSFRVSADLDEASDGIVALVGPNGSGKTSLLRALAGLDDIEAGRVELDGVVLEEAGRSALPPERRRIGVVFQNLSLFPQLTALDNVAFGIRCRGVSRKRAHAQAREWLARVGMSQFASHRPAQLSGGQAQRVALARALAPEPRMLLLDEPFAALDAVARPALRDEFNRHLETFDGVCIFVTHDPIEAAALAHRMLVMEDGAIVQAGSLADLRERPRSRYIAEFVGLNVYRGRAREGEILLPGGERIVAAGSPSGDVVAVVHPKAVAIHLSRPEGSPRNIWPATVHSVERFEDRLRVRLSGGLGIVAEITAAAASSLRLAPGLAVHASVKASEIETHPA